MSRSRPSAAIVVLVLLSGCAARGDWPLAKGQHAQHFERRVTRPVSGDFLLYLPAGFDPHDAKKYPLLIFMHGSGESGHDLSRLKGQGPLMIVETQKNFPFILASPQAPESYAGFDPAVLNAMLDELIERLPIDVERVYLTGLSMGGEWSYGWASMNPGRFAAIAPISGAWDTDAACALKDIPVWAFHGANDDIVPTADDQAMVEAINKCGGHARITIYPDVGHGAWIPAYADPHLYEWLLEHRRTGASADGRR